MINRFYAACAASLSAVALLLSSAGTAEAVTRQQFIERLQRIGVEIVHGRCDGSYGYYLPDTNVMCIHESLLKDENMPLWDETVTHEAVHVVQDCANGFQERTLVSLLNWATEKGWETASLKEYMNDNISSTYIDYVNGMPAGERRNAEIEAYTLEKDSDLVYQMLSSMCLERLDGR